jgi:hypothetical protein
MKKFTLSTLATIAAMFLLTACGSDSFRVTGWSSTNISEKWTASFRSFEGIKTAFLKTGTTESGIVFTGAVEEGTIQFVFSEVGGTEEPNACYLSPDHSGYRGSWGSLTKNTRYRISATATGAKNGHFEFQILDAEKLDSFVKGETRPDQSDGITAD